MKKICAITQVRNDNFFLEKWVKYYGGELGNENLYVLMDGEDQEIPDFCEGVNVMVHPKLLAPSVAKFDQVRFKKINEFAAGLFEKYDIVIGTDSDEFLILDPKVGGSLRDYLSGLDCGVCVSGLGVDIGEHREREEEIDRAKPLLGQRRFGFLSTRYTKASVLCEPQRWGAGFHRVKGQDFHNDSNLFQFHFGGIDYKTLEQRNWTSGWSKRHFEKRTRTIKIVTETEAKQWEITTKWAREFQQKHRPFYAPNKPSMRSHKIVVEVPERFFDIV